MTKPKAQFLKSARLVQSHGGVRWVPTDETCHRYGDISESTLRRRVQTIPGHPQPTKFTEFGANFYNESELDAYDALAVELSARRRAERMAQHKAKAEQVAEEARAEEARIAAQIAVRRGRQRRKGVERTAEVLP